MAFSALNPIRNKTPAKIAGVPECVFSLFAYEN